MKKLIAVWFVIASGTAAFASSTAYITFTALPVTQGYGTSAPQGNTYNGESTATIDGMFSQYLVCDDFAGTALMPSRQIDFSVETLGSMSGAMFSSGFITGLSGESASGMTQTQAYDTAAILVTNLEKPGNTGQQITDYQYAIWDLMLPGNVEGKEKDGPLDANAATYLQLAFTAATAAHPTSQTLADETALVIYTPMTGYVGNQEFLGLNPILGTGSAAAPEPSTWILLAAAGLVLSATKIRTRFITMSLVR